MLVSVVLLAPEPLLLKYIHRPWDVAVSSPHISKCMPVTYHTKCLQAGTIIAQEAGGLVNTSDLAKHNGEVTGVMAGDVLAGRKYIVIRCVKFMHFTEEPY
jgi:hypothetical protein